MRTREEESLHALARARPRMRAWATLLWHSPRGAPIRVHALRILVAIAGAFFLLPAMVAPLVWAAGGGAPSLVLAATVLLVAASGIGAMLHAWRPSARWTAALAVGAALGALAWRATWVLLSERTDFDWHVLGSLTAALVFSSLLLRREATLGLSLIHI